MDAFSITRSALAWLTHPDTIAMLGHLGAALVAGGLIGVERSYHGRPAGFRTHTLVCLASSLLMLVTIQHGRWYPGGTVETVRIDPTRMAQGVMTGIGFLGAGVIMKEGLSVRGLTTAASIWITAAIGILAGVGLYGALVVATGLTLGTLSVFRWIERIMPNLLYAHLHVRFRREAVASEDELRAMVVRHGFSIANLSYELNDRGQSFEYRMIIRTRDPANAQTLARTLTALPSVLAFRIEPTGD
jgi:putative Mg2+ transporter-C (MgtC) family protein